MDEASEPAVESDIVLSLIRVPFNSRNQSEKQHILSVGRPTPHVAGVRRDIRKGQQFVRSFKCSWYNSNRWLTSSTATNRLYCWPCLLLSKKKAAWNSEGFFDLKNLSRGFAIHSNSKEHIQNHVALKRLEKSITATPIEEALKENADFSDVFENQCNERVRKNRELFKRLIDVTITLNRCDTSLGRSSEYRRQHGGGDFIRDVFYNFIKRDIEVKAHCEQLGDAFTSLSKTIQNDLVECVNEEIAEFVQLEISEAPFFSVQVDDVTEISEKSQCSIVVRYVDVNGDVQERFLGFHDVSKDNVTKNSVHEVLSPVLEDLAYHEKLISQSYNGNVATSPSKLDALQESVRNQAPDALLVHSVAHPLNVVLQNGAAGCVQEARVFFAVVHTFVNFLCESAERSQVFKRVLEKHIVEFRNDAHRLYEENPLQFLVVRRPSLIIVFREVLQSKEISLSLRTQVDTLLNKLNNFDFVFLLAVYCDIFKIIDVLLHILNEKIFNIKHCSSTVDNTIRQLLSFRKFAQAKEYINVARKRTNCTSTAQKADKYGDLYFEIIDNIIAQLTSRFKDIKQLGFLALVDTTEFDSYSSALFPQAAFDSLKKVYASRFDFSRLKVELEVIYADSRFWSLSLSEAVKLLVTSELKDILRQVYTLFCLTATLPVTSYSTSRLGRVEAYLKRCPPTTTTLEGVPTKSAITIEKEVLSVLESRESWYNDVIFRYANKRDREIELVYKKAKC